MPHHLKYMLAHSGRTESRPRRANSLISSSAAHGFFSRFRRSTFCALVSFLIGAANEPLKFAPRKKKARSPVLRVVNGPEIRFSLRLLSYSDRTPAPAATSTTARGTDTGDVGTIHYPSSLAPAGFNDQLKK